MSVDAAPGSEGLVATAGADGVVVLFDRSAGRIKASLTGHSKKVNGEGFSCSLKLGQTKLSMRGVTQISRKFLVGILSFTKTLNVHQGLTCWPFHDGLW